MSAYQRLHRWFLLLLPATALLSLPLYAQEEQADDQAEDQAAQSAEGQATEEQETANLEKLQVTGTRFKRPEFYTASPVVSVTGEDIRQSTATTLGDLLNELPQLRGTLSLQNSGRFIGTAGLGGLDLRGLGLQRTLVLINGRRVVTGSPDSAIVDVNAIPTDLIERIDIVTGANSAVYGADAVSGSINIILKEDYDGNRFRASAGQADRSDFNRYSAAFTSGHNFADQRGNAVFSFAYDKQDDLIASEHGGRFTRQFGFIANPADADTIDDAGFQVDDGIPDNIFVPNNGFFGITNGGASLFLGGFIDPDGSFRPFPIDQFEFVDGIECGGAGCEFLDLQTFNNLQVGLERFTSNANFTYELNDYMTIYAENSYSNVDSKQQFQPSFDFGTPIIIQRDNAFVSDSLGAAIDNAGLTFTDIRRFNVDIGLRKEFDNRQTWRSVLGLRGAFGESWSYDVFVNYGRTTQERINENNRIDDRFLAAVDAVRLTAEDIAAINDPSLFVNNNPQVGDIVCRSTLQAAIGVAPVLSNGDPAAPFAFTDCVPINVLGDGNVTQAAADFVNSTAVATAEAQQFQTAGYISNDALFENWAGPVGAVLGFEWRRETANARGDSLSALGITFFNALADTNGSFNVKEVFAEFSVPLLRDVFLVEDLTAEGAVRISDYQTVGTTTSWEARLNWQPIQDVRVRGTIGEAVRAPNIGDLFAPAGENFNNIDDPCDMDNLDEGNSGRNVRIANCIASGVPDPENFDSNDEESIRLLSGGNPDLKEEESDTFTVGAVFSPRWMPGFDISVDYWDIEISDAIANTGSQNIADRCVDDPNGIDNQFCNLIDRGSDGNIELLRSFPLNLNDLNTSGVDIGLSYVYNAGSIGTFDAKTNVQFLDRRIFFLNSDDDTDIIEGELGDPKWEGTFTLNWRRNNWSAYAEARYIDNQLLVDQELLFGRGSNPDPNPDVQDIIRTPAKVYVDLGVGYSFPYGINALFNVSNVGNSLPPQTVVLGNGGGSSIFDNIGRFYELELSWDF